MTQYKKVHEFFPCCPICGSEKIVVHPSLAGEDSLSCSGCGAKWHIHMGFAGLNWAELSVEAGDGKGKELLGVRLDRDEWQRMSLQRSETLSTSAKETASVRTAPTRGSTGKSFNPRIFAVLVISVAFLMSLYGLASIPPASWRTLDSWQMASIVLNALTSFSVLLVAYWVYSDYDRNQQEFLMLRNRLQRIESCPQDKVDAERLRKSEEEKSKG